MTDIIGYVRWYSDVDFSAMQFNDVDNLVLSYLAYYSYPSVSEPGTRASVRSCLQGRYPDSRFIDAVISSKRFGLLDVSDYTELSDGSGVQFAAVTFEINGTTRYVAFRGTDSTLAGWKEDFMMCYRKTGAQKAALDYLRYKTDTNHYYYVGGHSKGANLALYSTCQLEDWQLSGIKKVYMNDGPGLCPDVTDPSAALRVKDRLTLIMPEYSLFGRLYTPEASKTVIVKSREEGLAQHSPLTWSVDNGSLVPAEKFDDGSEWASEVISDWIGRVDQKGREQFIEDLFSALESNGGTTKFDIANGPEQIENLISSLLGSDSKSMKAAAQLPAAALFGGSAKKGKAGKVAETLRESHIIQGIILILLGAAMIIVPVASMTVLMTVVFAAVVVYQLFITVRALYRSGWDFRKERIRIYLSIGLVALFTIILVKEKALFVIGSAVAGIFLIIFAVMSFMKAKDERKEPFMFWKYLIEGVVAAASGCFVLVAPSETYKWFAFIFGILITVDGISTIVYMLVKRRRQAGETGPAAEDAVAGNAQPVRGRRPQNVVSGNENREEAIRNRTERKESEQRRRQGGDNVPDGRGAGVPRTNVRAKRRKAVRETVTADNQPKETTLQKNIVVKTAKFVIGLMKYKIVVSVVMLVQGVIFIVMPNADLTWTVRLALAVLILASVVNIILHILSYRRDGRVTDIILSVVNLLIIGGCVFLEIRPDIVEPYVRIALGVVTIVLNIVNIIEISHIEDVHRWKFYVGLTAAVIMIVLGSAMIFASAEVIESIQVLCGVVLVINCTINIWFILRLALKARFSGN